MPTIIDEFPPALQNLGAAGAPSEEKGNEKASAASTTEAAR